MILPALLVGSGLKHDSGDTKYGAPAILPALLVGSGLKPSKHGVQYPIDVILPALLVGSGLKPNGHGRATERAEFSRLYWSGVD